MEIFQKCASIAGLLHGAGKSGFSFIVCCAINIRPVAFLGWARRFSGLALFTGGRSDFTRCSEGTGCTGLAPGSLVVVGIFRIIRCIAARSANCAVWCTDRVFITLKLEHVSITSNLEPGSTYCWSRRGLGPSTRVESGLIVCDDAGRWSNSGYGLVGRRFEYSCLLYWSCVGRPLGDKSFGCVCRNCETFLRIDDGHSTATLRLGRGLLPLFVGHEIHTRLHCRFTNDRGWKIGFGDLIGVPSLILVGLWRTTTLKFLSAYLTFMHSIATTHFL